MKKTFGILLTILLGLAVGIGGAAWRIKKAAWNPTFDESNENAAVAPVAPADRPLPKVRVAETEYNFGTLDISSTGSHDFIFTNDGRAPLRLTVGSTSCRCAVGKLERSLVGPGEFDQGQRHLEAEREHRAVQADGPDCDQRSGSASRDPDHFRDDHDGAGSGAGRTGA